ncbi:MAG: hypothetical protein KF878_28005 [Planctomycetes bacterium]|nr:hypothetical protein [Planctomycetota bacterium]
MTTARPAAPAWLPRLLNAPGDLDLLERACAELDEARATGALDAAALARLQEALATFEVRWSPPEPSRLLGLPDGRERAARDVQMLVALYELLGRLDGSSRALSPARRQHLTDLVAIAGGAENRIGPDTYRRLADLAPDFLPVYVGYNAVSKAVPTPAQLEQDVAMLRRGLDAAEALARAGDAPEHMVETAWNSLARGLTARITRMADAAPGHDKRRTELARAALPFAVEHAEMMRARHLEGLVPVSGRAAAEAWGLVSELHQRMGQHDVAAAPLDAAARLDPGWSVVPARRALLLLEVSPGDPRALGLAREALELAGSDGAAREHRGIIMHACRRTAAASASHDPAGVIAVCEEALRIFREEAYPSLAVYPLVLDVRRADVPAPRLALLLGDVAQRLDRHVAYVAGFLKDQGLPEAPVHAQWTNLAAALRAWGEQAREGIAPPGDALREALGALEYFVSSGLLP